MLRRVWIKKTYLEKFKAGRVGDATIDNPTMRNCYPGRDYIHYWREFQEVGSPSLSFRGSEARSMINIIWISGSFLKDIEDDNVAHRIKTMSKSDPEVLEDWQEYRLVPRS